MGLLVLHKRQQHHHHELLLELQMAARMTTLTVFSANHSCSRR
jgi:hypothetical protein